MATGSTAVAAPLVPSFRRRCQGGLRGAAMTAGDTRAVADWLIDGARSAAQADAVLEEMCERLVGCGIPLWRVSVFVRTLHPQFMGRRFIWRPGHGIEVRESPHEMLESADFRESPVKRVYDTNEPIRRRLADAGCPLDFPILQVLHGEAVTDYLALPLGFTNGEIHVATWTTREPVASPTRRLPDFTRSRCRWPASPRCARCAGPRRTCSIPMSGTMPASASWPVRSGAATRRRFTRSSGSPTCAGSRSSPIACRRRH